MQKSRWIAAVVAPVVVVGAAAAVAIPSIANADQSATGSSHPSAAKVLASVAGSKDAAFSGKLEQTSDLGLPSLPSSSDTSGSSLESGASSVLSLLTSSHSARVYVDGTSKARVQLLGQLSEQDVIVNGSSIWTWDSKQQSAVHYVLPSKTEAGSGATGTTTPSTATPGTATPSTATPTSIAQQAIAAITPSTKVSAPSSSTVAGRSAWTVTLTPKSSATLVSKVVLSVDKATGVPLAASIDANGQSKPALSVRFSSITMSTPASRLFDFTPPSGASVTTKHVAGHKPASALKHSDAMKQGTIQGAYPTSGASAAAKPTVTGTGWGSIVELPAGTASKLTSGKGQGSDLLGELTKQVDGGRAIQTSLVSVLITSDGRVLAGAVPVSALQSAAG
jgi:outer membrane lipoprotein-sorting protein